MTSGHLSYDAAREHNRDLLRAAERERRHRPSPVTEQRVHRGAGSAEAAIRVWWQMHIHHGVIPTR